MVRVASFLLALAIFITPMIASGQVPLHPPERQSINSDAERDSQADAALRAVVDASGGEASWSRVHSAMARYQLQGKSGPALTLLMLDDWSTDHIRYRRGFVGMKSALQVHDGDPFYQITPKGAKVPIQIREFDASHVLASHLPAAAALLALSSPEYRVRDASTCSDRMRCVDVFHRDRANGPFLIGQHWEIDSSTHLPHSIKLWIPNVIHNDRGKWESSTFENYQLIGDVLVPTSYSLHHPGATTGLVWSLQSFKANTGFHPIEFAQEVHGQ